MSVQDEYTINPDAAPSSESVNAKAHQIVLPLVIEAIISSMDSATAKRALNYFDRNADRGGDAAQGRVLVRAVSDIWAHFRHELEKATDQS